MALRIDNIGFGGNISFFSKCKKNNKNSNPKTDNKTNSTESKALKAAAIIGAAAVIIGGVYKHKTSAKNIEKEANAMLGLGANIQNESLSVMQKVCEQIDEVKSILLKDKDKVSKGLCEVCDDKGNLIRKYVNKEKGISALYEYNSSSGKLLRKSEFDENGALQNIKIYTKKANGYDEIRLHNSIFDKEILFGVKDYKFMKKIKKRFVFDCEEELQKVQLGVKYFKNSTSIRREMLYGGYNEVRAGAKKNKKKFKYRNKKVFENVHLFK